MVPVADPTVAYRTKKGESLVDGREPMPPPGAREGWKTEDEIHWIFLGA